MSGYHIHRVKFDISEGPVRLRTEDKSDDPTQTNLILELQRENEGPLEIHIDLCVYSALRSVLDMTDNWWEVMQTALRSQARHESFREMFGGSPDNDDDEGTQNLWQGYSPN